MTEDKIKEIEKATISIIERLKEKGIPVEPQYERDLDGNTVLIGFTAPQCYDNEILPIVKEMTEMIRSNKH